MLALGMAVLTLSDTRGKDNDRSGDYLAERIEAAGHRLIERDWLKDDRALIESKILDWAGREDIHAILTTGGTGVTARDQAPEALRAVADKWIDGFGECFRFLSYAKIGAACTQSRACAAVVGNCYVFCLPGSPSAVRDAWEQILETQLNEHTKPCNFAELLPRL